LRLYTPVEVVFYRPLAACVYTDDQITSKSEFDELMLKTSWNDRVTKSASVLENVKEERSMLNRLTIWQRKRRRLGHVLGNEDLR